MELSQHRWLNILECHCRQSPKSSTKMFAFACLTLNIAVMALRGSKNLLQLLNNNLCDWGAQWTYCCHLSSSEFYVVWGRFKPRRGSANQTISPHPEANENENHLFESTKKVAQHFSLGSNFTWTWCGYSVDGRFVGWGLRWSYIFPLRGKFLMNHRH